MQALDDRLAQERRRSMEVLEEKERRLEELEGCLARQKEVGAREGPQGSELRGRGGEQVRTGDRGLRRGIFCKGG